MARYYIEEDPDNPGHMTKKLICGSFLDASPIGTVHAYAGSSVPAGWLACNGQAVSRSEYQFLFNVIGTTYGSGDGSTTFNVPDYRECALVGIGTNGTDTIATDDVYTLGEFKDDQSQRIHGGVIGGGTYEPSGVSTADNPFVIIDWFNNVGGSGGNWAHTEFDSARNVRAGDTTRGKRKGVNFIIKAKLEANAGDIGLKTGIPVPDWGSAEAVVKAQILTGYTAPKDGLLIVGYFESSTTSPASVTLNVNNSHIIAWSYSASGDYRPSSGAFPICKGDVVTASSSSFDLQGSSFVPYKLKIFE